MTSENESLKSQNKLMKRWKLKAGSTNLESLVMEEIEIPEPGPGQVRIKMKAASINYRDQIVLQGSFGILSADITPLSDGAGEIDTLGEGVTQWNIGDKVTTIYSPEEWKDGSPIPGLTFGLGAEGMDGVLAEYIVLSAGRIMLSPTNFSMIEASTLPCAALTAWTAINGDRPYKSRITKGDKVLALGTGGVSLFALLLAKASGAEVFGSSSSNEKIEKLKEIGVYNTTNYVENTSWGEAVFAESGGVDKIVNTVGGSAIEQSIKAIGFGGEIAFMGLFDFAEKAPDFVTLMTKGAAIRGTAVGSVSAHKDLVNFVNEYHIKPPIDKVFPFDKAIEAYKAATSRDLFGKVVIEIN